MKWLKKLFILSVFLPIFLINNTSALEIEQLQRKYINTINFKTYTPNATYDNQSILNYVNSPVYEATVQPNNNFRASSLVLNTSSSYDYTADNKWDVTIFIYTRMTSQSILGGESLIPTTICPSFSTNGFQIDECETEYHDVVNSINQSFSATNPTNYDYLRFAYNNDYQGYYALKLKGHFTQGGTTSSLTLSGPFLSVYNPTSLALDFSYTLGFSSLRIYKEVEKEDKAAAELEEINNKDDEDRSDIESQSDSTDSEADSAGNAAESTGTSLFSAFTQLLTALTSVNGNSCRLPRMQVYSLDFGRMDLCQFDIPPQIMALVSIGMVFIIVPLGINLVKRMISLYKEITG